MKHFFFILFSTIAINAFSCGGGMYSFESYHQIFNQGSFVDASYQDFYLNANTYSIDGDPIEELRSRNVLDWQNYFNNKLTYDEVHYLLFHASLDKEELPEKYKFLATKQFNEFWEFKKLSDELDNNLLITYDEVWEGKSDKKKILNLKEIKEKLTSKLTPSSPFFKKRYAYQLIKLANQQKDYRQVNELYTTYFRGKSKQGIDFYAKDKQARYLNKIKRDSVQAAYSYLQIFSALPEKRLSAFNSVKFSLNTESMDLLKPLLRTKQEQLAFHFIKGFRALEAPISYLEKMAAIDPDADLTHLALARTLNAINRIEAPEKYYHQTVFNCSSFEQESDSRYLYEPDEMNFIQESAKANELTSIIDNVLKKTKIKDRGIWQFAKAQNCLFDGCFTDAEKQLDAIPSGSKIEHDKEVLSTLLKLNKLNSIGKAEEQMLYPLLKKIEELEKDKESYNRHLSAYFYLNLAKKYVQSGQIGKAFLAVNTEHALFHNRKLCVMDQLNELFDKKNKTKLEELLVQRFGNKYPKYALMDHYASYYLLNFEPKKALTYLQKIEDAGKNINQFIPNYYDIENNVFNAFIEYCFSCDDVKGQLPKDLKTKIPSIRSKYDLVKFLTELDEDKEVNPESAYLLANFYLNSSKHKHYRYIFSDTKKDGSSNRLFFKNETTHDEYIDIPIDNNKIKQLYELAMRSQNNELSAAAQWGAVEATLHEKIERPTEETYSILEDIIERQEMHPTYAKMKRYQETDFYQEAINECTLFSYYVD